MKIKNLAYMMLPLLSLFLLIGCGNASSDNQPTTPLAEEKMAIYIPLEELESQTIFSKSTNFTSKTSTLLKIIKEDAQRHEMDDKWVIYDKSPDGADISIVYDDVKRSKVIEFSGTDLQNGFVLGYGTKFGSWNNKTHKTIQWNMKTDENYFVYVRVSTLHGYRYLYYTPHNHNYGIAKSYDTPHYIHHGLGSNSMNGTWKAFSRDLEADLKEFDANNSITSVDGFFIRGSGELDDIALLKEPLIDKKIHEWISSQDLNVSSKIIISTDKTRAIVSGHKQRRRGAKSFFLDISNLEEIKELNHYLFHRRTTPMKKIIKDDDYFLVATKESLILYDYRTGKEIFSTTIGNPYSNSASFYLFEDNRVLYSSYRTKKLKLIDFTDRMNPIISTLHQREETNHYKLSVDKSKILVQENKTNNLIEEIIIQPRMNENSTISHALTQWIKEHNSTTESSALEFTLNKTHTRAISTNNTDAQHILINIFDVSNINNIKHLNSYITNKQNNLFSHTLKKIIFKDNNYVVVATNKEIDIFDIQTGTLLSHNVLTPNQPQFDTVYYTKITTTEALFHYDLSPYTYLPSIKKRIDYSNPKKPSIELLSN